MSIPDLRIPFRVGASGGIRSPVTETLKQRQLSIRPPPGMPTATLGLPPKQTFEESKHQKNLENRDSAVRTLVKVAIQMRLTKTFEVTMTPSTVTYGAHLPFRWKSRVRTTAKPTTGSFTFDQKRQCGFPISGLHRLAQDVLLAFYATDTV